MSRACSKGSKATIEDYMLSCLIKPLNGKNKVVQHEIVKDINNHLFDGALSIYDLIQKYASEMASVDGVRNKQLVNHVVLDDDEDGIDATVNSIKDVACHACKKRGHHARDCPQTHTDTPTTSTGEGGGKFPFKCGRCRQSGHKSKDCPLKGKTKVLT